METIKQFELYIRDISAMEFFTRPDSFYIYIDNCFSLFESNRKLLNPTQIFKRHEYYDLETILKKNPNRYFSSSIGDFEVNKKWVDLRSFYIVQPEDKQYGYFFACKLNHMEFEEIFLFLDYHLQHYYQNDVVNICQLVTFIFKEYTEWISSRHEEIARRWVSSQIDQMVGYQKKEQAFKKTRRNIPYKR